MDSYSLKLKDAIRSVTFRSVAWFLGVVLVLGAAITVAVYEYPFGPFKQPVGMDVVVPGVSDKGVIWKCALLGFCISIPTAFGLHMARYI